MQKGAKITVAFLSMFIVSLSFALAAYQLSIHGSGSVILTSVNLVATPTAVDFGVLGRGQQVSRAVTISNTGQAASNPLSLSATNNIGNVTWNLEGLVLNGSDSARAVFTLTVSMSAPAGDFSFDLVVSG